MNDNPATTPRRRLSQTAILWCSAAILAVLILFQTGIPEAAANGFGARGLSTRSGDVSSVDEYTALTLNTGSDEILCVLDGRSEVINVYRVRNKNAVEKLITVDLKSKFQEGKRQGSGVGAK